MNGKLETLIEHHHPSSDSQYMFASKLVNFCRILQGTCTDLPTRRVLPFSGTGPWFSENSSDIVKWWWIEKLQGRGGIQTFSSWCLFTFYSVLHTLWTQTDNSCGPLHEIETWDQTCQAVVCGWGGQFEHRLTLYYHLYSQSCFSVSILSATIYAIRKFQRVTESCTRFNYLVWERT